MFFSHCMIFPTFLEKKSGNKKQLPYPRGLTPRAFKLGKVLEWGVGVNPGGGGGV